MISVEDSAVLVEVKVDENLERVYLCPIRSCTASRLIRAARGAVPGAAVHGSIGGVWFYAHESPALLVAGSELSIVWSEEARRFVENRQRALQAFPGTLQTVAEIRAGGRASAERHLRGVKGLERLDDHQWVNVAAMTVPTGFGLCVFDEQGAGKTVSAIYAYDVLVSRDEIDFALILAPKSMVPEWAQDFIKFKSDIYKVGLIAGSSKEKADAIRSRCDVLITNYDTAVSLEDELTALLKQHRGRSVLIVDESFYVKNLDTRRTKAIRRLREWCNRAFVLCGTPAPNSPHDLVQQFNIADFGATFASTSIPKDRIQALPAVQTAINSRGLYVRHLKSQVLPDLPAKRFQRLLLPLEPMQRQIYSVTLRNLISDLRKIDDISFRRQFASFLSRRSALLQICSNPVAVVSGYRETPAKVIALDNLLRELIGERNEKIVLWSFYTASLEAIVDRYALYKPVRYDGSVDSIAERRAAVKRFQEDDETMLFVANPAAAGAGITLHRSRVAIFESMSNQAAHYLQSLDRIHRRGQSRTVEYIMLLCDKTIEVSEYETLMQKEKSAGILLGDQVQTPITRLSMLVEATAASKLLRP